MTLQTRSREAKASPARSFLARIACSDRQRGMIVKPLQARRSYTQGSRHRSRPADLNAQASSVIVTAWLMDRGANPRKDRYRRTRPRPSGWLSMLGDSGWR